MDNAQSRAHLRIIATKIDRDMRHLRSIADASPTARRRWIWELLQNGKDVHNGQGVRFLIETSAQQDKLVFKHTGKPFTADDIRFLIEQISTKDRSKNEGGVRISTGQFGTGFLSTHLLSEKVTVSGVAKEPELDYKRFSFVLDRGGFELVEIEASVEAARAAMANIDELPSLTDYDASAFNTEFTYLLSDDLSKLAATDGITDLDYCLPYTLIYTPEILELQLPGEDKFFKVVANTAVNDSPFVVHTIQVTDWLDDTVREQQILSITRDSTTVSIPISYAEGQIQVEPIPGMTPKLFCNFPLVGTELFRFPAVINNPNFEPTDARDGIYLTDADSRPNPNAESNKQVIQLAIQLFLELAEFAVQNNWGKLHNLLSFKPMTSSTEWVNSSWHRDNVVIPIRQRLIHLPIVSTDSSDARLPLKDPAGETKVLFPNGPTKEFREKLWLLTSKISSTRLPLKDEIETWNTLIWEECEHLDIKRLSEWLQGRATIENLQACLSKTEANDWIEQFYALLQSDEDMYVTIANKYSVFPNQCGKLCTSAELYQEKGEIPEVFKDVLALLDSDIRKDLASRVVPTQIGRERTRDQKIAAEKIDALVNEKSNDRKHAAKYREPFNKLLAWFGKYPKQAQGLFPSVYARRHLLYDDEQITENLEKADQLDNLMVAVGATTVEQLKDLLTKERQNYLPVTQDALASMGITNQDEWEAALKDKNLAELFAHESIPTTEMFILAQSMIKVSTKRVMEHLGTLKQYDVTNAEQLAPTVIGGILKDSVDIKIVVRPAWNGEVIIYYTAEQDVLDFEEYAELWADTGSTQQRITLGHILKKSDIRKFRI